MAYAEDEPELVTRLTRPDHEAVVQRAVVVTVAAFDWNCPQHITPRWTAAELEEPLAAMRCSPTPAAERWTSASRP